MNTSKIQNWKDRFPVTTSFVITLGATTALVILFIVITVIIFRFNDIQKNVAATYYHQALSAIYAEYHCEIREVHTLTNGTGDEWVHECTSGTFLYIKDEHLHSFPLGEHLHPILKKIDTSQNPLLMPLQKSESTVKTGRKNLRMTFAV